MKCLQCNGTGFVYTPQHKEIQCNNCLGLGEYKVIEVAVGFNEARVVGKKGLSMPIESVSDLYRRV